MDGELTRVIILVSGAAFAVIALVVGLRSDRLYEAVFGRLDAPKLAGLLVAEIKLYHQEAIEASIRGGTLDAPLRVELDRARSQFRERIPREQWEQHFEAAVVEALGGGEGSVFDAWAASDPESGVG